jgi:hypothetical protein
LADETTKFSRKVQCIKFILAGRQKSDGHSKMIGDQIQTENDAAGKRKVDLALMAGYQGADGYFREWKFISCGGAGFCDS